MSTATPSNPALWSRAKSAARKKFDVYPSAYANAYASKICAGKIKDPSGVKRKDFKGPKPAKEGTLASTKNPKRAIEKEASVRRREKFKKKIEANKSARYSNKPGKDFYGPRKPKLKKLSRGYKISARECARPPSKSARGAKWIRRPADPRRTAGPPAPIPWSGRLPPRARTVPRPERAYIP